MWSGTVLAVSGWRAACRTESLIFLWSRSGPGTSPQNKFYNLNIFISNFLFFFVAKFKNNYYFIYFKINKPQKIKFILKYIWFIS